MTPIKYAMCLLATLMALSGSVEAKKIVTRRGGNSRTAARRKREKQQREKRAREQRAKAIKARKVRAKKTAEVRRKRKAAAQAAEKDRLDKLKVAKLARERKASAAEAAALEEKAMLGEYDTMATEVRMSSAQRAKLVALVKKLRSGKRSPSRGNSDEIARLTREYNEASGAQKGIIAAALKEARKRGSGAEGDSPGDENRKVMSLLTDAQKLKWRGYKLAKNPALKFDGIGLSEKQIKRIRAICNASAKELPDAAGQGDPKTAKARKSVLRKIRSQIIFEVLTPEQRAEVRGAEARKRAAAPVGK